MRSRRPSTSACRIAGSVGSRGSPWPKSTISIPTSTASRLARSSRTNGYVDCAARMGETCTDRTLAGQKASKCLEGPVELGDLDPLVALMRVARRTRAEVDGVEAFRGELRDRRPGLLGQPLEAAGGLEAVQQRRSLR